MATGSAKLINSKLSKEDCHASSGCRYFLTLLLVLGDNAKYCSSETCLSPDSAE